MKVQVRRKRGRPARRWLDKVRYQREVTVGGRKCTTVLHGGVCHRTSTSDKRGNTMKEKMTTVSDLISGLSAYVILGQKNAPFTEPPGPYDVQVPQLKMETLRLSLPCTSAHNT